MWPHRQCAGLAAMLLGAALLAGTASAQRILHRPPPGHHARAQQQPHPAPLPPEATVPVPDTMSPPEAAQQRQRQWQQQRPQPVREQQAQEQEQKRAPEQEQPQEQDAQTEQRRKQQQQQGDGQGQTEPASALSPLNMVRTTPEQIGQVPNHFFWIRQGLQAVQDPVDGQLVFLTDEGRVVGRAKLPAGFSIGEIFPETNQVRLINESRQVTVPRTIDPATITTLQDAPAANGAARSLRLTRRGPQELVLQDDRRGGRPIDVRAMAGGTLAQAYEVGVGRDGSRTIVSEEIVGAKPSLQVQVFVRRYDREGRVTGAAFIPLDGMDAVPHDFITVTGDGVVRVLVPTESGVKIRQIELSPAPARNRKLNENELRGLGKSGREISVDTKLSGLTTRGRSRTADDVRFRIDPPTPGITREQVVKNAAAFLSVNWVMTKENYSRPGIENACVPRQAKFWTRPTRFTPETIGTTVGPMPYRWGGDDSPESFKARLEWGALAGDICTCRDPALDYCLTPVSAGVDCSGLISRAWGISKRGTSGLLDVATQIYSIADLKPGDAFDWPGRHVRLFVAAAPGASLAYTVIESSTRLECEGVCMRSYRPSELNGYLIIRYRGISD